MPTPVSFKSVAPVAPLRPGRALRRFPLTARRASSKDGSPDPSPSASSSSDEGPATPPAPADKSVMMQRIKSFGIAGTLSYVITEIAFWAIALPGAWIGERSGQATLVQRLLPCRPCAVPVYARVRLPVGPACAKLAHQCMHGLTPPPPCDPSGPTPLVLASGNQHPSLDGLISPFPPLNSGYHQTTGDWLSLDTDRAQLVGIAAAFVTGVRFMVPLRMGAALALVPTVQKLVEGSSRGKE